MERKYKDFLTKENMNEARILSQLADKSGYGIANVIKHFINPNLNYFIEYYDKYMCPFEQEVTNFDIERVIEDASIDCSYELLQDSNYADAGLEQIDVVISKM